MPTVLGFVGGFIGTAAPALGTAAFGGWAAGAAFSVTALGSIAGNLLASVALSALSSALAPDPPPAPGIKTQVTQTGGVHFANFVLGLTATDGTHVCPAMTRGSLGEIPNAYLTYVIELSDLPGCALTGLIVDGQTVPIDAPAGGGSFTTDVTEGDYANHISLRYYDGTQTEVDPQLLEDFGDYAERPWEAEMVGRGLCYAVLTFTYNREIFNGFPRVRFEMQGVPLYDPRKDSTVGGAGDHRWNDPATWERSENFAVQAYNIARGFQIGDSFWGGGFETDALPLDNWFAQMNVCDENTPEGPRYRTGLEIKFDRKPLDVMAELAKGAAAEFAPVGGQLKLRCGPPGLPTYFLAEDDLVLDQQVKHQLAPDQRKLAVTATHPDPGALWEPVEAPRLSPDGEVRPDQVGNLDLSAVPYSAQVQRLQAAYLSDEKRRRLLSVALPPDASVLEPFDVVAFTSATYGYDAKAFEVRTVEIDRTTGVTLVGSREREPSDFLDASVTPVVPSYPSPRPASFGFDRFGVALADAGGTIAELRGQIETYLGDIGVGATLPPPSQPLDRQVAIDEIALRDVQEAAIDAEALAVELAWDGFQTRRRQVDAGFVVDPTTGQVRIRGIAALQDRQQQVEVSVDALSAEVTLRATVAYVNETVSNAVLDLSQIPVLDDIEFRLSEAETTLDGATGDIASLSANFVVDGETVTMTQVDTRLSSAEATLAQTVSTSEFQDLEARTSDAELTLDAIDGAGITLAVSTVREQARESALDQDARVIDLWEAWQDRQNVRQVAATGRRSLDARIDQEGAARAEETAELLVALENTAAVLRQESLTRAQEDEALSSLLQTLQASVGQNTSAISQEATARANEDQALANLIDALETTVGSNASAISQEATTRANEDTALAGLIDALQSTVGDNTAAISQETQTRANEDSALAGLISALQTTTGQNTSAISQEAIARADADSALAGLIDTLESTTGQNTASIDDLSSTRVTAAGAVAAVNQEISASFGSLEAMAEATAFAEATVSGIAAGFVWTLGGDDVLSLVQVGDGVTPPSTQARIQADLIELTGDTSISGSFVVSGGNIRLTGDTVIEGSFTVSGANVVLDANTQINGDFTVSGGNVVLDGNTQVNDFTVTGDMIVGGVLSQREIRQEKDFVVNSGLFTTVLEIKGIAGIDFAKIFYSARAQAAVVSGDGTISAPLGESCGYEWQLIVDVPSLFGPMVLASGGGTVTNTLDMPGDFLRGQEFDGRAWQKDIVKIQLQFRVTTVTDVLLVQDAVLISENLDTL